LGEDDDHPDHSSEDSYDRELVEIVPEEFRLEHEDDGIWDELQRAGIEVVINCNQDRGWRLSLE
jgi:hypothetical protein